MTSAPASSAAFLIPDFPRFLFVERVRSADISPTNTFLAPSSYRSLTTAPTTSGFVVAGCLSPDTTLGFTKTSLPFTLSLSKPPIRETASLTISSGDLSPLTPTRVLPPSLNRFSAILASSFFIGLKKNCAIADFFPMSVDRKKPPLILIRLRRVNILRRRSPLPEYLSKERLHGLPGTFICLFVVRHSLGRVIACLRDREAVHCAAITHHLPVHAPLSHLILKRGDMLRRHKGVVSPVESKHLRLDLFGILWSRCIQTAVKTHHPSDICAASGKLKDRRSSETISDACHALRVCQFVIR